MYSVKWLSSAVTWVLKVSQVSQESAKAGEFLKLIQTRRSLLLTKEDRKSKNKERPRFLIFKESSL
jgi:hypothetical protein